MAEKVEYLDEFNCMDVPFKSKIENGMVMYYKYDPKMKIEPRLECFREDNLFEDKEHTIEWEEEIEFEEEEEEEEHGSNYSGSSGKVEKKKQLESKESKQENKKLESKESKVEKKQIETKESKQNNNLDSKESKVEEQPEDTPGEENEEEEKPKKFKTMQKVLNYKIHRKLETRREKIDRASFCVELDVFL